MQPADGKVASTDRRDSAPMTREERCDLEAMAQILRETLGRYREEVCFARSPVLNASRCRRLGFLACASAAGGRRSTRASLRSPTAQPQIARLRLLRQQRHANRERRSSWKQPRGSLRSSTRALTVRYCSSTRVRPRRRAARQALASTIGGRSLRDCRPGTLSCGPHLTTGRHAAELKQQVRAWVEESAFQLASVSRLAFKTQFSLDISATLRTTANFTKYGLFLRQCDSLGNNTMLYTRQILNHLQ